MDFDWILIFFDFQNVVKAFSTFLKCSQTFYLGCMCSSPKLGDTWKVSLILDVNLKRKGNWWIVLLWLPHGPLGPSLIPIFPSSSPSGTSDQEEEGGECALTVGRTVLAPPCCKIMQTGFCKCNWFHIIESLNLSNCAVPLCSIIYSDWTDFSDFSQLLRF